MAAEYYVRLRQKVHGPFSGSQLKKLADKGEVTREAEVGTGKDGPWFPATKVAGLFDDAPREKKKPARRESGESSSSSRKKRASKGSSTSTASRKPKKSSKKKSPTQRKKRKAVLDPSDVFDLDEEDSDDDVEFLEDDEDELFEDDDFYEDDEDDLDDRPRRRPRGGRGGGRSRGRIRSRGRVAWGQVRVGLLLFGIGVCIYTGAYGLQALMELITYLTLAAESMPGRSTGRLLELTFKGSVIISLIANVLFVVGGSMSCFLPGDRGAKGLAVAVLSTIGVHLITHFIYVFQPVFDSGGIGGFGSGFFGGGFGGADFEITFLLTWGPYYAGLILFSCMLWAVAESKKDYRHSADCINNVWLIGIYTGLLLIAYLIGKLELIEPGGGRAMFYLLMLLRLGHLALLGVYLGRLIPQTFYSRNSV